MTTGVIPSSPPSTLSTILHQNINIPNDIVFDEKNTILNYITLPSQQYIKESILDLFQDNIIGINYGFIVNKISYNYLISKNICINNNNTLSPTLASSTINNTSNINNKDITNDNKIIDNLNLIDLENKPIISANIIDNISHNNLLFQSNNNIITTYILELSPLIHACLIDLCSDCCIYIHENKYYAI
jgi:hypothetical protein